MVIRQREIVRQSEGEVISVSLSFRNWLALGAMFITIVTAICGVFVSLAKVEAKLEGVEYRVQMIENKP